MCNTRRCRKEHSSRAPALCVVVTRVAPRPQRSDSDPFSAAPSRVPRRAGSTCQCSIVRAASAAPLKPASESGARGCGDRCASPRSLLYRQQHLSAHPLEQVRHSQDAHGRFLGQLSFTPAVVWLASTACAAGFVHKPPDNLSASFRARKRLGRKRCCAQALRRTRAAHFGHRLLRCVGGGGVSLALPLTSSSSERPSARRHRPRHDYNGLLRQSGRLEAAERRPRSALTRRALAHRLAHDSCATRPPHTQKVSEV